MPREADYYVASYRRRRGRLVQAEVWRCADEAAAFRRGKRMLRRCAGLVWYRVLAGRDDDVWSRVETLASVGDVPEAAKGP